MSHLPASVRRAVLIRSFAVQGSWNYETLIGTGFAFTILPALRFLYGRDERALTAAVIRHAEVFNSHPYLVTIAAGAVMRLEMDGADPALVQRLKFALRGSLGSLGDQLIWSAWRPASVLLGLVLILAGAAWWVGVTAFLLIHNGLHLVLRVQGLRAGIDRGLGVARYLREAPLQGLATRAADSGAFLAGMAAVLVAGSGDPDSIRLGAGIVGAAAGLWLGLSMRSATGLLVGAVWTLGIILGLVN